MTSIATTAPPGKIPAPTISCVICAFNEAGKIGEVLNAVRGDPLVLEIIVVDDGSTDGTAAVVSQFSDVRLISYPVNRGKTCALARGIAAARGDYLLLLDADLNGVTSSEIQALIDPVADGMAKISISLRGNSLAIYRMIGLDFISGERLLPRALVAPHLTAMEKLPRWGCEVFMNDLITRHGLPIAVVDWRGVRNLRKSEKLGYWQGLRAEIAMTADLLRVLSPLMVFRQNLAMLKLVSRSADTGNVWSFARRKNRHPRFQRPISAGRQAA
jgi:glycosyltransferase involved in cell wall biosynthesis